MIKIEDLRIGQIVYDGYTEYKIISLEENSTICKVRHVNGGIYSPLIENLSLTPPKRKKEGWLNIYPNGENCQIIFKSREEADRIYRYDRVDCIRIEWEE